MRENENADKKMLYETTRHRHHIMTFIVQVPIDSTII